MRKIEKPKIGLLGLMTDGYEPNFPGITARQENYARELASLFSGVADVDFPGAGLNRASIEQKVRTFNERQYDGILIVLLTYSHAVYLQHALQDNRLPIALAVIQPDYAVKSEYVELDLTVNQGIHGAQDNANMIVRSGFPCQFFAGERHDPRLVGFVEDFARAAMTYRALRGMKVGVLSRMCGMGDILVDDMAFYKNIGVEICNDTVGSVYSRMQGLTKAQIDAQIEKDRALFTIDPKLGYESHAEAVKLYLGFKQWLTDKGFDAFTAQFDIFGDDKRFRQLPLYAASQLMADGFGYAAEGDFVCAAMVAAAHRLGDGGGNFTEMYMMDFEQNAICFCHAGEGNWATHRKDVKPRLIDRYLGEGGLENPPTLMFTPEVGRSTLTSLAPMSGDRFRLVVATGDVLPKNDLVGCEMPYIFWRPDSGMTNCVENWLRAGGTHHEVISLGDVSSRWKMLCDLWGAEFVRA
ncbi:MAG: L-fucose/L-arabinose isomerase family protein [Eubacteriales bacterium]|nr:L-fucose/L-arabinose isomerase family protein [Eubacteriales bacterium]